MDFNFFSRYSDQANGKGAKKSYLIYIPFVLAACMAIGAKFGRNDGMAFGGLVGIAVGVFGALILDRKNTY